MVAPAVGTVRTEIDKSETGSGLTAVGRSAQLACHFLADKSVIIIGRVVNSITWLCEILTHDALAALVPTHRGRWA